MTTGSAEKLYVSRRHACTCPDLVRVRVRVRVRVGVGVGVRVGVGVGVGVRMGSWARVSDQWRSS